MYPERQEEVLRRAEDLERKIELLFPQPGHPVFREPPPPRYPFPLTPALNITSLAGVAPFTGCGTAVTYGPHH
jgi:hypothetical protein